MKMSYLTSNIWEVQILYILVGIWQCQFWFCFVFVLAILICMQWYLTVALICMSLMTKEVWAFFHVSLSREHYAWRRIIALYQDFRWFLIPSSQIHDFNRGHQETRPYIPTQDFKYQSHAWGERYGGARETGFFANFSHITPCKWPLNSASRNCPKSKNSFRY